MMGGVKIVVLCILLVFIVGKVVLLLEYAYYSLVNFIMTVCIL